MIDIFSEDVLATIPLSPDGADRPGPGGQRPAAPSAAKLLAVPWIYVPAWLKAPRSSEPCVALALTFSPCRPLGPVILGAEPPR